MVKPASDLRIQQKEAQQINIPILMYHSIALVDNTKFRAFAVPPRTLCGTDGLSTPARLYTSDSDPTYANPRRIYGGGQAAT